MSEQKIEGMPDGWRLVRIGTPNKGDCFIDAQGDVTHYSGGYRASGYAIIEKIEQPKQFRQFANAAEFEQHRDRWVEYTSPNYGDCSMYRVSAYTSERVWLGPDNAGRTYKEAFHCLRFDDGSPFGVEVTE